MNSTIYDVIIIGGGPAGLTAAIYTSRDKLSTLLLEKGTCGGLPAVTDIVENYPGFPDGVKGLDLINKFKKQAQRFGASIVEFKEVVRIEPSKEIIKVNTGKEKYNAHAVIIASGSIPKKLNIPGEEKYKGRGVSYCATCDGPLFKNKDIAVIGCGNSGLQEGEFLLNHVKSATFIESLPYMTADKILQERLSKNKNAKFLLNHILISINGKDFVDSVTVKDRQTNKEKEIKVLGVFIYAGFLPNSKFVEGIVKLDEAGYIITDEKMQTSTRGIYAAGDVRLKQVRQIDIACAEGTIAAISVRTYIKAKFT